jgi:NAD(P)-dependent dehydrogenase (short-subunit alcohol dehydrogenase family)
MSERSERVVITGANRGLGLELARCYATVGAEVWAGCRRPVEATALREVTEHVHPLDLGSAESIDAFAEALGESPIDVLINNGGVDARSFGVADGERDVLQLSGEHFLEEVRINALGPLLLTRVLLDRMLASARPRVINVSSQVGSMEVAATTGRDIGYTASKAALNMITVKLAMRLRDDGLVAIALHPGFLRTDMGGSRADLDPADAAASIVGLIDGLGLDQSGRFLRWDGTVHPW